MKFIKIKNSKTGLFCSGDGDFQFDAEGRIFGSSLQVTRYMKYVMHFNKDAMDACKDDIEVVEFSLIPQKTNHLNINTLR